MEQQKDALLRIIGTVQAKYNESSIFATELQSTLDSLESAYKDSIYELDSQFKLLAQGLENARNRMVEEIDKDLLEKEKPIQERLKSFEDARLDAEELISLSNEALVIMDPSDFSKRALKIKDRVTMSPVFRLSLSPLEIDPTCYYVSDFSREQRVISQMNFLPVPCQPEVIGSSCFVEDNVVHCVWSAVDEDDHGALDCELFSEAPASVYSEMPTILPSSVNYFILQYRQSNENESDNEPWTTVENIRSLEYDIKGLVFHKTSVEIRVQAWNKALGGSWSLPCMVPTDAYNFTLNPDACHPNLKVVTENIVEWDPTATKVLHTSNMSLLIGNEHGYHPPGPKKGKLDKRRRIPITNIFQEVRIRSAGPNRSSSPVKGISSSPRRSKTKDRFTGESYTVLGNVPFTEEESYFEVTPDPECKTYSIGITAKTLSRFDQLGRTPTSWCIHVSKWIQNTYVAKHNNKVKNLETTGEVPSRFGVYYNLSAGLLSFYNADTKQAVHTFKQVKYNGAILPGFLIWFGSIKIHTGIQVPSWIVSRPSNSLTPRNESLSQCSNDTNGIAT